VILRIRALALLGLSFFSLCCLAQQQQPLRVLVIDGVNNHDWAAGTRYIQAILEGTRRFQVDVCTYPAPLPADLRVYAAIVNNFNGGHTAAGTRWPREAEQRIAEYVRVHGGGLVIFHAANNAFLEWSEYNDMIGLGWRDPSFGAGLAIGRNGEIVRIPKGQGARPGHGPRQDFTVFVRNESGHQHPITNGLPAHWVHRSEQLTHGQHGPAAETLDVLTYAFSEVTRQGEPMDWVREYGKGRIYATMLGHTWKNEPNPNLEDVHFQALLARGVEWAATGQVTLTPDLGWKAMFNGKNLDGWETRGSANWTWNPENGGILLGQRAHADGEDQFGSKAWPVDRKTFGSWLGQQAWLYTTREDYGEFDLHAEYWLPHGANSGISIRDRSRAHGSIGETDEARPALAGFPKVSPAHIGYEIQIIEEEKTKYPSGSVYSFVAAKTGFQRKGEWNSIEVESRKDRIRVRINGEVVAEHAGDPKRPLTGPIGLQLHDQFSFVQFRNVRIRER
jgi:uncharacterized protein